MGVAEDCKSLELISLHIPKTGGSALKLWFEMVYGKSALYFDYDENPQNTSQIKSVDSADHLARFASGYPFLKGKKAVHGHLSMNKYQFIENVPRITFLRNPIERLISDYWNEKIFSEGWKNGIFEHDEPFSGLVRKYRAWNRKLRIRHNPLQTYFFKEKPSIVEFASIPLKKYFYSVIFFGEFGPEKYDFIGDHAKFDDEMNRLKNFLGVDENVHLPKENITAKKADGYKQFKESVLNDPVVLGGLKDLLAGELDFYEKYSGR